MSVTVGRPSVSVPVLSNATAVTAWARSSASASLIRMPCRAAAPVPTMMAVGVASPSAQGQAITITDTAFSSPATASPVPSHQPRNVSAAIPNTTGTNTALTRSTRRWIGALLACAPSTMRTMRASVVSAPTAVARTTSNPSRLIDPPVTRAPGSLSTGRLSPVSMASSTLPPPSASTPSAGIRSPGRTTRRSPGASEATATSMSTPSRRMRAVSGRSAVSARMAEAVLRLARPSSHLPSRMKVMISAELSK